MSTIVLPTSSLLSLVAGSLTDSFVTRWISYLDSNSTVDLTGLSAQEAEREFLLEQLSLPQTTNEHLLSLWRQYMDQEGYTVDSLVQAIQDWAVAGGASGGSLDVTLGNTEDAVLGVRKDSVANRTYFKSYEACWAGYITGTDASMDVGNQFGATANMFRVSVDGGAFSVVSIVGGSIQLFSGLSDTEHFVQVTANPAGGSGDFVWVDHNALSITGTGTTRLPAFNYTAGDGTYMPYGSIQEAHGVADFLPATWADGTGANSAFAKNVPSTALKGAFSEIIIMSTTTDKVFVSVDGGVPTQVDMITGGPSAASYTPPDNNVHTFNIWGNAANGLNGGVIGVGTFQEAEALSLPQLHHFGHSIIDGAVAGGPGYVDMPITAARNGYVHACMGLAGDTIPNLKTRMTTRLASTNVGASDVAVMDIGRNDLVITANVAAAMTTQNETDYTDMLDDLILEGYGTVLCLSVMDTDPDNDYTPFNTSLQNLVNGYGNANVIYVNRSAYDENSVTTSDNTHPTPAGYLEMNELNKTSLDPLL